ERRADEVQYDVRLQVAELHRMSCRLVAHRLTPPIPDPAIMRIGDEPVTKPSQRQHDKNNARRRDPQNFPSLKLPPEKKRRYHQPRRVEPDRLPQVHTEPQESCTEQYHP